MNEGFRLEFSAKAAAVSAMLARLMDVPPSRHGRIYRAMRYSLLGGGKRLRGVLTLACCELAGGQASRAMPFACALEMIHAYSLIHDDLPAMDNDHLRRGQPTCHIKFDEATAILAGDALLNRAFEVVLDAYPAQGSCDAWRALGVLARASGADGMIGGQVVDMLWEGRDIGLEELEYMHSRKTGALIKAAACAGAILGGMDDDGLEAVSRYGAKLGYAFQIKDDILDMEGDAAKLGKPCGSDMRNSKATFVTALGMDAAKKKLAELVEQAMAELARFGSRGEFLRGLAQFAADRES